MARMKFHIPAEWEKHEACWLARPSHEELWGPYLEAVQKSFHELCRAIAGPNKENAKAEKLNILVLDQKGEEETRKVIGDLPGLNFYYLNYGDVWLRDTAPLFVVDEKGEAGAVSFRFNGWGGKYILPGDDGVSAAIASLSGLELSIFDMVCEGGALEFDGAGACITTRQCLLNPSRNRGWKERDVESVLHSALGVEKVIWLDEGLANDHTDGHVDNIARFVAPGRVICMRGDADDPNRKVLEDIRNNLLGALDAKDNKLEVVEIPSPGRVYGAEAEIMPAGYLNFYISNTSVTVPVYGSKHDVEAIDIIQECFPDRKVFPVEGIEYLRGGGAFHCVTMQQPSTEEKSDN